jgi:hypothetical protein
MAIADRRDRSWKEASAELYDVQRRALVGHIGIASVDEHAHLIIHCRCRRFDGDPLQWAAHLDHVRHAALEVPAR